MAIIPLTLNTVLTARKILKIIKKETNDDKRKVLQDYNWLIN